VSKIIVALFDNLDHARHVVSELRANHFKDEEISLVTHEANLKDKVALGDEGVDAADKAGAGAVIGGLAGLLAGVIAISIPGIGPLLALGPLATAIGGAGIGAAAGGLVGALTASGVPKTKAQLYADGVRRGNVLVTVHTADDRADVARDIMNLNHPLDLEQRSGEWQLSNFSQEGKEAEPFPREAIDREQFHYAQNLGKQGEDSSFIQRVEEGQGASSPPDPAHVPVEEPIDRAENPVTESQTFGFSDFETRYREHFTETYGETDEEYRAFQPAYYFGYRLAYDDRFHDLPWDILEPDAHREWEKEYPENPWNKYQQAVHEGWYEVINTH
jgi:hypothetical protein